MRELKLIVSTKDRERMEKGRQLASKVKELGDGEFLVESSNGGGQQYKVRMFWENGSLYGSCSCKDFNLNLANKPGKGEAKVCKHIWAVIFYRKNHPSNGEASSVELPSPPSTEEEVPEVIESGGKEQTLDERFRDLPQFGVMVYQGKTYVTKDGLLWGLYQHYPKATIQTGVVVFGEKIGFWAKVEDPESGRSAMGHGFPRAGRNPISQLPEMAETRAINRAIRHLLGWPTSVEEVIGD